MTPPDAEQPAPHRDDSSADPATDDPSAAGQTDASSSGDQRTETRKPSIDVPGDPNDTSSAADDEDLEDDAVTNASPGARIPAPISPAEGATVDQPSVTFEWERVVDAETYQLQIATDRSFEDRVFDGRVGASTQFTYSGLPPQEGVSLFWRVRAYRSSGTWTDYGTMGTFVLADWRPEQPALSRTDGGDASVAEEDTGGASTVEPMSLVFALVITVVAVGLGILYVEDDSAGEATATSTTAAAEDTVNLDLDQPVPNDDGETYRISIDRAMEIVVERRSGSNDGDTLGSN